MTFEQVRNTLAASDVPRPNLLVNGGFQVWQRGNGPFSGYGNTGPDRWVCYPNGTDTISVQKATGSDNGWGNQAQVAHTVGTGGGFAGFVQLLKLTDGYNLASRTLSMSARVNSNVANSVRIGMYDANGGTYFATGALNRSANAWETITLTATVPGGCQVLWVMFQCPVSCSYYVCNAMLVQGNQPADYVQLPPADDLARCLRYYEWGYLKPINTYAAAAGTQYAWPFYYAAKKGGAPTLSKSNWGLVNANTPQINYAHFDGFAIYWVPAAIGTTGVGPAGPADWTAEWNP